MQGILRKVNDELVIFKGINYSITDKLDCLAGYNCHIHIVNESGVLLDCKGRVSRRNRCGVVSYWVGNKNISEVLNKQLNSWVNVEINNITIYF